MKILEKTLQKRSSIIFTMFLNEGSSVYNAVVLADAGKIKAVYRKIHLFDAFGYKESALFASGKELTIVDLEGFTVGLAICFDFRFPELFRQLAYRGVDLFIVPSAWYKGEHKLEQWRILTKARAHENASYLVAVDQTNPFFVGHSIVVSPMAHTVHEAEEEHITFTTELDRREIEKARESMSILKLAKPTLYRSFDMDR
jgi:predicted amidohydrolase